MDEAGFWAAEGTVYHDIAEMCVRFGLEPEDFVGKVLHADGFDIPITEDVPRWMHHGLNRIADLAEGNLLIVEERVDLSMILGRGEAGKLDLGILDFKRKEATGFDWKFGQGVPVAPSWTDDNLVIHPNEQLTLYIAGFCEKYLPVVEKVAAEEWTARIIIEQPRAPGGGGEYTLPLSELMAEAHRIGTLARLTRNPNAPRTAGEKQCRFCKAKNPSHGGCDEHTRFVLALTDQKLDSLDEDDYVPPLLPDRGSLTIARQAYVAIHADMLEAWISDIRSHLLDRARKGVEVPGMKMVAGRAPARKYKEGTEKEAEKLLTKELGEEAYAPREIVSPTQAEKKLTAEAYTRLSKFVDKGTAKVALVPVSSKGEALKPVSDNFDDEDVLI